jgi:hypothetical protein
MLHQPVQSIYQFRSNKLTTKNILFLALSIVTLIFMFSYYDIIPALKPTFNTRNYLDIIKNFEIFVKNESTCKPFLQNKQPEKAFIDNEYYPKSDILHQSNQIDFECLNRNEKIKTILFWTPFFGNDAYHYGLGLR